MEPSYLTSLSPEQRAACLHGTGPLLIVAGAGSGKTRALTHRTAHLVHQGVAPERILVSTFTNKATEEFRGRLHKLLGDAAGRLNVGTLHATGARILRNYANELGYTRRFSIYDTRDSYAVIRRIMKEREVAKDFPGLTVGTVYDQISRCKENLLTPSKAIDAFMNGDDVEWEIGQLYWHYQDELRVEDAMDFGDLIMNTVHLLLYHKVRDQIKMDYVLVDEFQDTDWAQFNMVQLLLDENKNLTAVGDIDQAIYSFRGADHQIMYDFKKHFPGAVIQPLGKNYRCTKNIVEAAASVIEQNKNRIVHILSTDNPSGYPVVYLPVIDEKDEGIQIIRRIRTAVNKLKIPLSEIAILYRTNIQSQPIEEALLNARIPYHVVGQRFFERREILDVLAYLRLVYNPNDSGAWRELLTKPKGKISKTAMDMLEAHSFAHRKSLSEVILNFQMTGITQKQKAALSTIIEEIDELRQKAKTLPELVRLAIEDRGIRSYYRDLETEEQIKRGTAATDNLQQLLSMMKDQYPGDIVETLPEFLQYASLLSEVDNKQIDGVQLMTLHAAKGTEYEVVVLAGVEEDILPHWRARNDPNDPEAAIEEERRLFYVGMTRAKQVLYLTTATYRKSYGKNVTCSVSRFLYDIPPSKMVKMDRQ